MVGRAQYPSGHRNLVLQPPIITSGETAIYLHIFGKRASGRGFCWCSTHFQLGSTPPKPKKWFYFWYQDLFNGYVLESVEKEI